MKKLDDIPKKAVFGAPEGYFDTLPTIVQSRVTESRAQQKSWAMGWRLAMPLAALVILGVLFWPAPLNKDVSPNQIVAGLNAEDILDYMQEENLNTEDLLEQIDYSQVDDAQLNMFEEESVSEAELEKMIEEL